MPFVNSDVGGWRDSWGTKGGIGVDGVKWLVSQYH